MRGQEEMNILSNERGQVYLFASCEFGLKRKRICHDIHFQICQADDAMHADTHGGSPGREEAPFAQTDIQTIGQSRNRRDPRFLQIQSGRIFLSLQMEGLPLWDLTNVNFHDLVRTAGRSFTGALE